MSSRQTDKALNQYVNSASDLAESVKRNLKNNGIIDQKTVLLLNEFITAANEIDSMVQHLNNKVNKFDN
jgi:hypothetical protein